MTLIIKIILWIRSCDPDCKFAVAHQVARQPVRFLIAN
jgi:hypothetical protein